MTALSDVTIRKLVKEGKLRIEPFNDSDLTSNGYKMRVSEIFIPRLQWKVTSGMSAVPRMAKFIIRTRESVILPPDLYAEMFLEKALCDKGIVATLPLLETGHSGGSLELTAHNKSERTIELRPGDVFVHLVFHTTDKSEMEDEARPTAPKQAPAVALPSAPSPPILRNMPPSPLHGGSVCQANRCSECCIQTEMVLTNDDVKRLISKGYSGFYEDTDGWLRLKNVDEHCVFLETDGCSVYEDRPIGCRLYPVVWDSSANRPMLDVDCPHSDGFIMHPELEPRLREVVKTLQKERRERKGGVRVPGIPKNW